MATASASARSRGRFWRRSDALSRVIARSEATKQSIAPQAEAWIRFASLAMTSDSSPLLRRNIPQPRRMRRNILDTVLQMHALVRWQLLGDAHTRPPLGRRAGSAAAQNRRRSSGRHCAACCPRNPRRTCIRRNISARPQHSAAGPCRNIRSSAEVAAPWRSRDVNPGGSSQMGGKTRMTNFPRFGPCFGGSAGFILRDAASRLLRMRSETSW